MGLKKNGNLIIGVQSEIHKEVGVSDLGSLNCHLSFGVRQNLSGGFLRRKRRCSSGLVVASTGSCCELVNSGG